MIDCFLLVLTTGYPSTAYYHRFYGTMPAPNLGLM